MKKWFGILVMGTALLFMLTNINKDKKSLAFRIKFHSENRTLTDKEVNKIRDKLVSYLYTVLGIELRI